MSNNPPATKSLDDTWLTIKLLAKAEPAFTESAIRYHVFNAAPRKTSKGVIPGNGLAPHIRRLGSKVLINHGGFLDWLEGDAHQVSVSSHQSIRNITSPRQPARKASAIALKGKEDALKKPSSRSEPPIDPIPVPEPYRKSSSRRQR